MANQRPQVTINDVTTSFSSYAEIKRNIKLLLHRDIFERRLSDYMDAEVRVSRLRRGKWGEWFEYWSLNENHKPVIKKQGWM